MCGWLDEEWPRLYPIVPNSGRFPGVPDWGLVVGNERSGVYFLIALRKGQTDQGRRVIPRMLDFDATGTLYIGKADWNPKTRTNGLAARLGNLTNSIRQDRSGSNHGLKILREHPSYRDAFPAESLAICWKYYENHGEAAHLEDKIMKKYVGRFGEAPPFNSQGSLTAGDDDVPGGGPVG